LEDCLVMEIAMKKAGTIFGAGHGIVVFPPCAELHTSHNRFSHAIFAVQSRHLKYRTI
jgi:hypothetical protein